MEANIHEKILVLKPSCTNLGAHVFPMFLFTTKKYFSAKVQSETKFT